MKKITIKRMAFISIFAALSTIFYFWVKLPLPFFPSFLELNFSMIAVLICAFMLGPVDAVICVIVRFLIKLPFSGTLWVGELSDLMLGTSVSLTVGLIYKYGKFKFKTVIALIFGVIVWIISGVLANYFINIPLYEKACKGLGPIIGMSKDALKMISFGHITDVNEDNFMFYYLVFAVVPFNLLLGTVISVFTGLVHKKLKVLYDKIGSPNTNEYIDTIDCDYTSVDSKDESVNEKVKDEHIDSKSGDELSTTKVNEELNK